MSTTKRSARPAGVGFPERLDGSIDAAEDVQRRETAPPLPGPTEIPPACPTSAPPVSRPGTRTRPGVADVRSWMRSIYAHRAPGRAPRTGRQSAAPSACRASWPERRMSIRISGAEEEPQCGPTLP